MNTVYVLMEEGWDYNDETYFQSEAGGGHPKCFFTSQEEADKACLANNLTSFKELWTSGEIREYCYGVSDLLPYDDRKDKAKKKLLNATCESLFGMDWEDLGEAFNNQDEIPIQEQSDETWTTLFNLLNLNFWNVVKVEKA
jgi:hypothetical protein